MLCINMDTRSGLNNAKATVIHVHAERSTMKQYHTLNNLRITFNINRHSLCFHLSSLTRQLSYCAIKHIL